MPSLGLVLWLYAFAFVAIVAVTVGAAFYWAHLGDGGVDHPLDKLFLFPIRVLVLPFKVSSYYLLDRGEEGRASGDATTRRRLAGALTIAGLFAILVGSVVAPPDPFSMTRSITVAFLVGSFLGFLLTR